MFKLVLLQLGATLAATALGAAFFGVAGAMSAMLAGLACTIPNGLFALRLSLSGRHGSAPSVFAFFAGETVKVAAIVGLLALIFILYKDLHWGALLLGMILALKANLFAFLVKI